MRILLIGGTMFIGRRLVTRLLASGHEITLLHRKSAHPFGPEVRSVVGDRNDAPSVRSALSGQHYDAVYDIAYDWERGTTGPQVPPPGRFLAIFRVTFSCRAWRLTEMV